MQGILILCHLKKLDVNIFRVANKKDAVESKSNVERSGTYSDQGNASSPQRKLVESPQLLHEAPRNLRTVLL
jgi:hypothetical protein